jgi:predicted ATPase
MNIALARHDVVLRAAIESAGGYVFKTAGDAFCATFTSARAGIEAAATAQRALQAETWPDHVEVRVRMALHTGECVERDGDYFGPAVNRTARLEATAHGGQIVVSRSTAELVRDRLPDGVSMVDLELHLLKDMDRAEEVSQIVVDGPPADFPPLRSRNVKSPTNLTGAGSSFVGRDDEVAEVIKLLGTRRLVTLTGPGGVGKTRLATEVGRALLPDSVDGVWISELAMVGDPALVASEVLSDLGIAEQSGQDTLETLLEVLATQSRIVILDNCEQVLDGCATLADAVVRHCPDVVLLATSREPLRIGSEAIYRVPSLSLPPEQVYDRSDLTGSGAVALFIERAGAWAPDFAMSDSDFQLVADICRRLDGMPLALELATARLRSLSLAKLADRLEHRFGVLTGGSRVALPRQQTLRALVDWSYDLLSEQEQALFRRTSVFVDGFDLDAAEGVCALDDIPSWAIADDLASLVDKSLVVAEPDGADLRYRLQETLSQYGAERLAEGAGDEGEHTRAAHAEYYLDFAERVAPDLNGRSYRERCRLLEVEDQNLRAAIGHTLVTPEGAERVLRHFWSLEQYWRTPRQPAHALGLLDQALERIGPDIAPDQLGQALYCKASLLYQVDNRLQLETFSAALALARQAGDRALEADALSRHSHSLANSGRGEEGRQEADEAVALARQIGEPVLLGKVLYRRASVAEEVGEGTAGSLYLEALDIVQQTGDQHTASSLHNNYACLLLDQGELEKARNHLMLALETGGNELNAQTSAAYNNLGWVYLKEGDPQRAATHFTAALRAARLNGTPLGLAYSVLGLAGCAATRQASEHAAVLHGGADALLAA